MTREEIERAAEDGLLSPRQAAARLAISEALLRRHVDAGEIPYILLGRGEKRRKIGFDPADLDAFVDQRKQRACPSTAPRARRSGTSISGSVVVAFTALPKPSARPRRGR
jgi:hypothetical protein